MGAQHACRGRDSSARSSAHAGRDFLDAQRRVLDRYRVDAQPVTVEVPTTGGRAQVLVGGEGPPLVMVIGAGIPAAFWAPLMAELSGRTLYAVELPGFGLTDPVAYRPESIRRTAVDHLAGLLDVLGVGPAPFVTQSMGSQWTAWLALDQPERVTAQCMIGCPAFLLDTSAILVFRLASVPGLGPLLSSLHKPSARGAEQMLRMVGEDPVGLGEVRDLLVAAQELPTYPGATVNLMRAVMSWTRPRPEIVLAVGQLREIGHPVRLIWGDGDPFGHPAVAQRAAELLPEADACLVPGGHAPWLHHADRVAGLTREFLER